MRDQAQDSERQGSEELAAQKQAETSETAPRAGDVEEVRAEDRSHFFAVANSLIAAMHWQSPELVTQNMRRREVNAVTLIYEARTARETDLGGGNISALERMRCLNEGLAALQGVLAMARSSTFPQARPYIEEIRRAIARLKDEIAQAIVADERRKHEEQDKKQQETRKGEDEALAKKAAEAETRKS
jgi:hypothetical protein